MRAPEPHYPSFSLVLQQINEPFDHRSTTPSSCADDHDQGPHKKDREDPLMVSSSTVIITLIRHDVLFFKRTVYYTYEDGQPPVYHSYPVSREYLYNAIVIELLNKFNVVSRTQGSADSTTGERRTKLSSVFMWLYDVLYSSHC
jgi:hypothetical protein